MVEVGSLAVFIDSDFIQFVALSCFGYNLQLDEPRYLLEPPKTGLSFQGREGRRGNNGFTSRAS